MYRVIIDTLVVLNPMARKAMTVKVDRNAESQKQLRALASKFRKYSLVS
jgi:hypothetical protein